MPFLTICGIWWKKGTKAAAASSIAVGVIVPTLLFTVLSDVNPFGHAFWPSLILSFLTYFIVSKFTKPLPAEFVDDLFKYKEWEESQDAWDSEAEPAAAK